MKRLFDIVVSILALLLLSPLMMVVAVVIFLHDRGPILFRQDRIGRSGQTFQMLKFRSMVVDAERKGGFSTAGNDPRITVVGHFIRRTSVDELPQLLNVLNGDMSLVGPRPDVPAQAGLYKPEDWRLRHTVRPGITGLAQATKRSAATPEERTELDLAYARSASFWLDLKIIALTIGRLLSGVSN